MSTFESEQDQAEYFRLLVESAHNFAIFGVDLEGRITTWNSGAVRIKGYRADEVIGRHYRVLFTEADRQRGKPEYQLREALAHGEFHSDDVTRVRKDGTTFDAHISLFTLKTPRGEPLGFVKVTEDVSSRKQLQRKLIEQEVFARRLVAVVAHDLRNPLTAILLLAGQLRKSVSQDASAQLLSRIIQAADRAKGIVGDILDVSEERFGGGISLARKRCDLARAIADVVDEHRAAAPHRDIRLTVQGEVFGLWDGPRLTQAVSNLIANALQHGARDRPVLVIVEASPTHVSIAVHNDGPPIPDAQRNELFQPFRRGQPSDTKTKSLGLGLYIAERVVAAHQGSIEAHSTVADGTTFLIQLPREDGGDVRATPAPTSAAVT